MRPWRKLYLTRVGRGIRRFGLGVDSAIDTGLYQVSYVFRRIIAHLNDWIVRLRASLIARIGIELSCEGLNALTIALFGLFLFAIPAMRDTADGQLKKPELAVTFYDRTGALAGRRGVLQDDSVPLEEFPDHLIKAVLATEDRRFFDHYGVDPVGIMRALMVNAQSSHVVQGGSTLTQQLAKNLFLSNQRTIERKIKEVYIALWLEGHLSKREILKLYLDRAYMGGGTFGVTAASRFYFGKSVRDINLAEAAMLAGLFKAPTKYSPNVDLTAARARASDVLDNLVDSGFMSEGQVFAARQKPATPIDNDIDETPDWYLDYAYSEVKKLAQEGKLKGARVLSVRLALDRELQAKASEVINMELNNSGKAYHASQAATVVMEPNGAVRAIIGGRDYGESQFNRAIDAQRQPGSSFKPYVYVTALMTGKFTPSTVVVDRPTCIGDWCVHNYGGSYAGALPLANALARSLNTIAVQLSIAIGNGNPKIGRAKIVETAHNMGITTPLDDTVSLPVGQGVVTVIDQATAYSAFANGGYRITPYTALEIRDGEGNIVYRADRDLPPPRRVLPESVVATMNGMLNGVTEFGTGVHAKLTMVKASGKTGTTNGFKDAWFCGFTGNFVEAVWYGNDDYTSMNNMTGGTLPALTWHEIMTFAHRNVVPKDPFGVGDNVVGAQQAFLNTAGKQARSENLSQETGHLLTSLAFMLGEKKLASANPDQSAPTNLLDEQVGTLPKAAANAPSSAKNSPSPVTNTGKDTERGPVKNHATETDKKTLKDKAAFNANSNTSTAKVLPSTRSDKNLASSFALE